MHAYIHILTDNLLGRFLRLSPPPPPPFPLFLLLAKLKFRRSWCFIIFSIVYDKAPAVGQYPVLQIRAATRHSAKLAFCVCLSSRKGRGSLFLLLPRSKAVHGSCSSARKTADNVEHYCWYAHLAHCMTFITMMPVEELYFDVF